MQYLFVTVTLKSGLEYPNPLKLSESYLICAILKQPDTESVKVELCETSKEHYKAMFG